MGQFFEDEIILHPNSPAGGRFKQDTQPFSGLLLREMDNPRWRTINISGPSQTGKSLMGYVGPGMYHLFEVGETVICAVPHMSMAADKWQQDFLPAIERSRYRHLLPTSGPGSRGGGNIDAITFKNGAMLRFMSGGGDDKKVAGFTSRILLITEANGLSRLKGSSNEAGRVKQLKARIRAFGDRARIYQECTEETEADFIHQHYLKGSASLVMLPCPHCGEYVYPTREHLVGWQDAGDELEAAEKAHLICPDCGHPWTEEDRVAANRSAKLLHRDQSIDKQGNIIGDMPRTKTLGFRWSAVHNMLRPIASVGVEEWEAVREVDEESAKREMMQFVWGLPTEPKNAAINELALESITQRMSASDRGLVPAWSDILTLGIDCGQYLHHWVLLAADRERHRHIQVVDYGVQEVHSHQMPVEQAVAVACRQITAAADACGYPTEDGEVRHPNLVWWDAGWKPLPIYQHCKGAGPTHSPTKGLGLGQYGGLKYHAPKSTGSIVQAIYDGFHLTKIQHKEAGAVRLYEIDADKSKARVHDRLTIPIDEPGALLLPRADRHTEHTSFAKHLMAEQLIEVDGVQKWAPTPGHAGKNHWLDASALALAAVLRLWNQPKGHRRRATGDWAKTNLASRGAA